MPPSIDLTGQRFGRLVAQRDTGRRSHGQLVWLCRCDCGSEVECLAGNLRRGHVVSCGCHRRELAQARGHELLGHAADEPYHPIVVNLSDADRERVWRKAKGCGLSMAGLVRQLLREAGIIEGDDAG